MKLFLSLLIAVAIISAQPNQLPACPEGLPGVESVIPIDINGATSKIVLTADQVGALNAFAADMCEIYRVDSGSVTGEAGAVLPQAQWATNLLVKSISSLIENIVQRDPKRYGSPPVKAAAAQKESAEAEVKESVARQSKIEPETTSKQEVKK